EKLFEELLLHLVPCGYGTRRQESLTKSVSEVKTSYDQRLDNMTSLEEKLVVGNTQQVPRHAKFLKEMCTSKRKLKGNEKVLLGENMSAMIHKKLPIKCKDPVQKVFELNDEDSLKAALTNTISESENKEFEPNLNLQEAISKLKFVALVNKIVSYLGLPQNNAKLLPSIIQVLRDYKEAIGWTVADISDISPSMCIPKILLEEGANPAKQVQRRLNSPMMEVVKKEIQKLLDAGIIYLISDSKEVSPIQVVPKKTGVTIIENSNGFHQIPVAPEDQEKTTFTCPFVSAKGLVVDKAKIDVIKSLPYPKNVREVRSFLGHA
nr:hypothetical protein [Tanacetum cinerariifolium]